MENRLSAKQLKDALAVNSRMKNYVTQALRRHPDFGPEDILQNALISAMTHIHQFSGKSKFTTWYTRIVVNQLLMVLRRRVFVSLDSSTNEEFEEPILSIPSPAPSPEVLANAALCREILVDSIKKLSPTLRYGFFASIYEGCGSDSAKKGRRFRARRQLQVYLRERGLHGAAA
jgi:RNA polymerase sigma factor (sigma-70 family)